MPSEELFYSTYTGPAGNQSPRCYTRKEIAAARRQGFMEGRGTDLHGPAFWAGGDWWHEHLRQKAKDYSLLAAAVDREWKKAWQ